MITFILITLFLSFLQLLYFPFLFLLPRKKILTPDNTQKFDSITLVLFSHNNKEFAEEKINSLHKELVPFRKKEIIIVDYNSTDGSLELFDALREKFGLQIIHANNKGVAHALNIGVSKSNYDVVVFCDLRQKISEDILQNLIKPLHYKGIGVASAVISEKDTEGRISVIRCMENMLKSFESRSGNLIGVYGPLYAVKKSNIVKIPDEIILEDLYLSLSVLKNNHVVLCSECVIVDLSFEKIYNYKRARRYVKGLLQLAFKTPIISRLGTTRMIMLLWHKYLRLFLPMMITLSILFSLILCLQNFQKEELIVIPALAFLLLVLGIISSAVRAFYKVFVYYLIAPIDCIISPKKN